MQRGRKPLPRGCHGSYSKMAMLSSLQIVDLVSHVDNFPSAHRLGLSACNRVHSQAMSITCSYRAPIFHSHAFPQMTSCRSFLPAVSFFPSVGESFKFHILTS